VTAIPGGRSAILGNRDRKKNHSYEPETEDNRKAKASAYPKENIDEPSEDNEACGMPPLMITPIGIRTVNARYSEPKKKTGRIYCTIGRFSDDDRSGVE
jgi:hypothetical protein